MLWESQIPQKHRPPYRLWFSWLQHNLPLPVTQRHEGRNSLNSAGWYRVRFYSPYTPYDYIGQRTRTTHIEYRKHDKKLLRILNNNIAFSTTASTIHPTHIVLSWIHNRDATAPVIRTTMSSFRESGILSQSSMSSCSDGSASC